VKKAAAGDVIKADWRRPKAFSTSSQAIVVMAANSKVIIDVTGVGSGWFV
jgi:phage/plasmid-associated DNA primase